MECVRHAVQGARQGRGAVLAELAPLPCSRSSVLLCARLDARLVFPARPCPVCSRRRRATAEPDATPTPDRTPASAPPHHDARRSDPIESRDVMLTVSIPYLLCLFQPERTHSHISKRIAPMNLSLHTWLYIPPLAHTRDGTEEIMQARSCGPSLCAG